MQMFKYLITHPVIILTSVAAALSLTYIFLIDVTTTSPTPVEVTQPIVNHQVSLLPTVGKKKILILKVKPENTVLIFGEIGENAASIANRITSLSNNSEPTILLINSPGGSVMDGALIISAMEASLTPVYAVCMQLCASMAAMIEGHATKRLMVDRSFLMNHQASGGLQGSLGQMQTRLDSVTRYVYKMDANVAARAGMSLENFLKMTVNESWLDAEDAVNQKFADGLVSLDLSAVDSKEFRELVKNSTRVIKTRYNLNLGDF